MASSLMLIIIHLMIKRWRVHEEDEPHINFNHLKLRLSQHLSIYYRILKTEVSSATMFLLRHTQLPLRPRNMQDGQQLGNREITMGRTIFSDPARMGTRRKPLSAA